MTTLEDFRKVLITFSKEELMKILYHFKFSASGKKEKLVENILKNPTFREYGINKIIGKKARRDLIKICKGLGIESDASASELKQHILQKLDKTIDNKDLQKQSKFLDICFNKNLYVRKIKKFKLSTSKKKSDLIELIAKNDSIMLSTFMEWKSISDKPDIKDCCEELGIKSDGKRKDLETRIEDYLFKKEKISTKYNKPQIYSEREYSISKTKMDVSEEDLKNNFARFNWDQMEELVGKLFEAKGYQVEITQPTRDNGIDVWATNHGIPEKIGIQVKHQDADVGFDSIAKTIGSVTPGLANKIILLSTKSGFTKPVYEHVFDSQGSSQGYVELWKAEKFRGEIKQHLISTS